MKTFKLRLVFTAVFLLLLAIEIIIGLFAHDGFVRTYLGDTVAVIALYSLMRVFLTQKPVFMSLIVLTFAVAVDLLGIENRLIRVIMGTSFSLGDIAAYLVGAIPCLASDVWILIKYRSPH